MLFQVVGFPLCPSATALRSVSAAGSRWLEVSVVPGQDHCRQTPAQGMFLSRDNSVPRHPALVFYSMNAIKISGPGQCEMNFGGVLKPWL